MIEITVVDKISLIEYDLNVLSTPKIGENIVMGGDIYIVHSVFHIVNAYKSIRPTIKIYVLPD